MTPEQLFEKNQRLAYWVIGKKFNNIADDPDTLQEAMIALWAACRGFKPDMGYQFSTYAARIVYNRINNLRVYAERKYPPCDSLDRPAERGGETSLGELIPSGEGWENDVIARLDFDKALASLTPKQRETICGIVTGATQKDIALREGVGQQAVNERCRLARKKLAVMMG
mgnify:CR=1 FL=1